MDFHFTGREEVLCLLVGEIVYVYYFVLLWKRPSSRLLALLPLLPLSFLVSWRGQTGTERILYTFIFVWNMGSKLLLLAWDRGPADDPIALSSFPRFFFTMVFSLQLKSDKPTLGTDRTATVSEASTVKSSSHGDSEGNGLIRRKSVAAGDKRPTTHSSSSELEGKADSEDVEERSPSVRRSYLAMVVTSRNAPMVILRSVFYFLGSTSSVHALLRWKRQIPEPLIYWLYFFSMYFSCLFIFDGAAAIPALIFGVELQPQFDLPFLATSLGEFWGRRWNRFVNNLLRASVYEPIIQWEKSRKGSVGGNAWKPSREVRAVGTFACFLVSGLMHELILFNLLRIRPTFEMTLFFVVHGIGVILESILMQSKLWPRVPLFVKWAYTVGIVWFTSGSLFFAPVERHDVVVSTLVDLRRFYDWIQHMII